MLDKFSWLHLSDFHFKASGDLFSQEVSTSEILADIPLRLSSEYPVEFVVVTGDIAFSGQVVEYELAIEFFKSLAGVLSLSMDRIFIVPGNHDVDRNLHRYLYSGVLHELKDQKAVDDFLGSQSDRAMLLKRQAAFRSFQEQYFTDETTKRTDEELARIRALNLQGLRVCILELNSAWVSGHKDEAGSLLMGERQMINVLALAQQDRPHLTIALAHHPIEWLAEFDSLSCNKRLIPRLHIFHTGHLHRPEVSVRLSAGTQCVLVAAGSSHASRHYENSYNLVEFGVGSAECRVRRLIYLPASGEFDESASSTWGIALGESLNGKSNEIAGVLRATESSVHPYADYLAAILTGEMTEVPVKLSDGGCIFASQDFPPEFQFPEVQEFLRLRNLLRICDDIPLEDAVAMNKGQMSRFHELLSRTEKSNPEFAIALETRVAQAKKLTGGEGREAPPYQVQYLDDLMMTEEWEQLQKASRRYLTSTMEEVRITARRRLSWALLRSQDPSSQKEGIDVADENLGEPWADFQDYIIASVGSELVNDNERALNIAMLALRAWPWESGLRHHCRSLATRLGNQDLAQLLKETGGNA